MDMDSPSNKTARRNYPPSIPAMAKTKNISKYINVERRPNVEQAIAVYGLSSNPTLLPRRLKRLLGEGSFGEVTLESFPDAVAAATTAAGAGAGVEPQVAVKKTLEDDDYESVCAETAALRYCVGLPNVAQLVGVVSTAAAGNIESTALPRIMMAPAKSSLVVLLKGPTAKHATASDRAKETDLKTAWGDLYPYAIEADGFVPAFDNDGNASKRADADARLRAASAASKRIDGSRPILARSWLNIKSICLQVLRGYYVLHSWGLVHRDTKPGNMLVTHYGEVQITDFGNTRYHTKYLEPIQDSYTGTTWYASPEVLMAEWLRRNRILTKTFTEQEWKKHDAWAVGATLYEVLTRDAAFTGDDKEDVLYTIFAVKGAPVADDGFIFSHYSRLPHAADISRYPRNPNAIIGRIKKRAIIVSPDYDPLIPDGPSEFLQLAQIIQGLLELNPEKRLSIEMALSSPLFGRAGSLPVMPPRPFIASAISIDTLDVSGLVTDEKKVNNRMSHTLNEWLMQVSTDTMRRESAPFVLDRAITYYKSYFQYYTTDGKATLLSAQLSGNNYINTESFQALGIIAFMISAYLFNSAYTNEFNLESAEEFADNKYDIPFLKKVFDLYIEGNIPFYGRTYFDELLAADPVLPTVDDPSPRIYALGTLNAICHAKYYYDFRKHLPVLYRFMSEHATEHITTLGSYFTTTSDGWDETPLRPEIKKFIDPLSSIVEAAKANKPYLVQFFLSQSRPSDEVITFARSADCPPEIREMILAAAPAPAASAPVASAAPIAGGARKKSRRSIRRRKNSQRRKSKKNRKSRSR